MNRRPPLSEGRRAAAQAGSLGLLAAAWRLWLSWRYYGWEESDYGNLMLVREVLDSHFTWFRPDYGPGFYAAAAAVRLLLPDPRLSALLLTMALSVASVVLAALLARKLLSPSAAWLTGLWLTFQPDLALQGASTLRYPVYGALCLLSLALLVLGSTRGGFGFLGAAFLTRWDALFAVFLPAFWIRLRDHGARLQGLLLPALGIVALVGAWQAYVTGVHGEGLFFRGPIELNVGLCAEDDGERLPAVLCASRSWDRVASMLVWLLPRKLGWTWLLLAVPGGLALASGRGRTGGRAVAVWTLLAGGYLLAQRTVSDLDPNHNLFWAWLVPVVAPLALCAGAGWAFVAPRLRAAPRPLPALAFTAVLLSPAPSFVQETRYQLERSERWYRPQLEHSRWLEAHTPPGAGVVVSAIPEVWLKRTRQDFAVHAWWTLPDAVRDVPEERVGRWMLDAGIRYAWWFREEWTDAPAIAPGLAAGEVTDLGPARFTPLDREDEYGWILYAVHPSGEAPPPAPPRYTEVLGPGWR